MFLCRKGGSIKPEFEWLAYFDEGTSDEVFLHVAIRVRTRIWNLIKDVKLRMEKKGRVIVVH